MRYKVGAVQFKPEFMQLEKNLEKMGGLAQKNKNADLLVFPELATSGYLFENMEQVASVAESYRDGKTKTYFTKIAEESDTSFIIGFVEREGENFYNSSMLINPDGTSALYRKLHLFCEEKEWFKPGNLGMTVSKAKNGVAVGLLICFDWIFPEAARTLAIKGAQVLCHSANLVLPWCQKAMSTRSLENMVFSITANRVGKEVKKSKELAFTGQSQIVACNGELLLSMNDSDEGAITIDIDPEEAFNKKITEHNDIFKDRRPDYYTNL